MPGDESMLSVALGVAIGVTFVFMLFSLFLSTLLEAISSMFKLRGRALRTTIAQLIDDPEHDAGRGRFGVGGQRIATAADGGADAPAAGAAPVAPGTPLTFASVFCHPLVGGADPKAKPSYVPSSNFSTALVYALRADGAGDVMKQLELRILSLPQGQLRDALHTALLEAEGSLHHFKAGVERWYEHAIDRLAGQYKRFIQAATFVLGLAVAAAFNIDAVAIAKRLYVDPMLRKALEQQASDYVSNPPPQLVAQAASAPELDAAAAVTPDFNAHLAAARQAREDLLNAVPFVANENRPNTWAGFVASAKANGIGWLITALAGMLGGPFWFELLQKFVSLRGAGPKPAGTATPPSRKDEQSA